MTEEAQAIQYMIETTGWRIVEKHIRDRLEGGKNQLLTCPIEEVSKHRARVEALNGVLLFVQNTIREGRQADE